MAPRHRRCKPVDAERDRETLRPGWSTIPRWNFCTTAGTPYDPANLLKAMRRALRKGRLPAFRVYDLRHTFATQLLDRSAPITYVAGQLGHADATTTVDVVRALPLKATARYVDLLDGGRANTGPHNRWHQRHPLRPTRTKRTSR